MLGETVLFSQVEHPVNLGPFRVRMSGGFFSLCLRASLLLGEYLASAAARSWLNQSPVYIARQGVISAKDLPETLQDEWDPNRKFTNERAGENLLVELSGWVGGLLHIKFYSMCADLLHNTPFYILEWIYLGYAGALLGLALTSLIPTFGGLTDSLIDALREPDHSGDDLRELWRNADANTRPQLWRYYLLETVRSLVLWQKFNPEAVADSFRQDIRVKKLYGEGP